MAIAATLQLDGKGPEYNVIECDYEFNQPIDSNGKPSGNPRGGIIRFTIQAPDDNNPAFHEWMMNKSEMKNGVFKFEVPVGTELCRKELKFQFAHCIGLHEHFNNQESISMFAKITLSAAIITFAKGGAVFTNNEMLV